MGMSEVTLLPQGEHAFRLQDGRYEGESIRFVLNEKGVVMHARMSGLMFVRE
jgi:hypothetical protein